MFGPEFPVVDTDPTFSRVMRYMRTSDLGLWAGTTAAFPALMYAWGTFGFLCNMVQMGRGVVKEVDMWKDMRKRRIEWEGVIWRGTKKGDEGGYGMAECKTID